MRAKIGLDEAHPIDENLSMGTPEAEAEGCGDPTAETDNEVWPDLRRSPGPQTRDVCAFG